MRLSVEKDKRRKAQYMRKAKFRRENEDIQQEMRRGAKACKDSIRQFEEEMRHGRENLHTR